MHRLFFVVEKEARNEGSEEGMKGGREEGRERGGRKELRKNGSKGGRKVSHWTSAKIKLFKTRAILKFRANTSPTSKKQQKHFLKRE